MRILQHCSIVLIACLFLSNEVTASDLLNSANYNFEHNSTEISPRESRTKLNNPSFVEKKSTQDISLKLDYSTYDSSDSSSNSGSSSNIEFHYNLNDQNNFENKKINFLFGFYPENNFTYIALPEAYYSNSIIMKDFNLRGDYSFGRKESIHNALDEVFHLGIINPYFTHDKINYSTEGLTGLHTTLNSDLYKIGFNYYPIFIPNQGPQTKESNGHLISENRWASGAPEKFSYNGTANTIQYSITDYSLSDLMSQTGYSLTFQSGNLNINNFEFDLSYSDTPINDIVISRRTTADLDLNGSVKIYPVVRFSKKISSDIKYKYNNITYFASYMTDSPVNKFEPEDRAVQFLNPLYGYGAGLQIDFSSFFNRSMNISASFAEFFDGEITDYNADGSLNSFTISNSRLQYQKPFKFNFNAEAFQLLSSPIYINADWIYDLEQQGSLFSISLKHETMRHLNISLGMDILGVTDDSNQKTFLSRHQADDRLTGALEYVF